MHKIPLLLYLAIACGIFSCSKARETNSSEPVTEDLESNVPDTVVHSIPINYSGAIESLSADQKMQIKNYEDILELFEKLNYTPEAWQSGIREVPRVYLTLIGDRWGKTTSQEITVLLKKQLFFRGIAPLILKSNELILKDRERLKNILKSFNEEKALQDEMDKKWILKLAALYKVTVENGEISSSVLDELWKRVDIIPPSLALSQSAEESGWGTSRFAASGNALYGQWTWGSNAMVPEQQRKELGNYGIAAFETLQESVSAYMLNLNTHNAYAALRDKRAELRRSGEKITGSVLAEQLTKYSERGEEYVKGLKSLMEYNRLSPADDAYLSKDPPIFLIPKAE